MYKLFEYGTNYCLHGPAQCGKTSILFDIALQMAAHHSNQTCFITNKQLQELPVLSKDAPDISNLLLTKIQLEYLSTADQLAAWFNGVHLRPKPHPSLVVIDNYDQYFTSKDTGLIAQLSAHVIDGIHYISGTKMEPGSKCTCVVALNSQENYNATLMSTLPRWFPSMVQISPTDNTTHFKITSPKKTLYYKFTPSSFQIISSQQH